MRFTEEQRQFAAAVRDFCDSECKTLQQRDALTDGGTLANSPDLLAKLAELGWLGVSIPEAYGGAGAGMVEECLFLEQTSRGLAPITAYSTGLTAAQTYLRYGTEAQKKEILGGLCRGTLEAIALSEPEAGSDLGSARISAVADGDDFIINGQKTWTSAAHVADHLLLLARTSTGHTKHEGLTLLIVPTDAQGLEIRPIETMEAHTVNDLFFTDVRVPSESVVGEVGRAWWHLLRGLSVERLIIAAMAVGAAQRSLDDLLAYVKQREQFGRTIGSFQAVRHRVADLATEIAFCRSFVYEVAEGIDAGEEQQLAREGSMAKLKCTEVAKHAALEAMQLMGGYGYAREYGMEGQVRKAHAPPIYGGTNEIQREIISKSLGL
ncbi:acyl-CoA dehydrogenase family protein [Saccharopolyspora endophytica]|uniref:Acyl-CoA/acyl-ACP dehydrogenase n=1 Tax=Saccharopolyspora endophytica TaxID=543886 RepID=A0ABS5DB82_9PSEU|nr:acyl-CoA dehydrogenase family protein [Saccharopolyspora endophytica]MBQ0923555.1 acyl-CoA/acyl-ACP dehydrogenase [Saccharopolyspora endophytica]